MKKLILLSALMSIVCMVQSQSWNLTGNSGTNPAVNFLGTTDNNPLKFRVANVHAGEIDSVTAKTFYGYGAGKNTTAAGNVAIGFKALHTNTGGFLNTATGAHALQFNTTGSYNTANGNAALYSNTTGYSNTATGFQALWLNTTGNSNTANGYYALGSNSTGQANTAVGFYALLYNSTGFNNTAIGYSALSANTTGHNNTVNGYSALRFNTTGRYNTANGTSSLENNTTGSYNTAYGLGSLWANTTGTVNTATGFHALSNNTNGYGNTANGYQALYFSTTAYHNTATGYEAMFYNNTGSMNTTNGYRALRNTTASYYNIAVGYNAGWNYDLGWNNTLLGANTNGSFAGQYNIVAVGQGVICTDNSTARIGNSATWSIGGYAGWTNFSDGRYKKNIKENVSGLEFIMKLRPVTYNLDISGVSNKSKENNGEAWDEKMKEAIAEKETALFSGFVAQEVEQAAKESSYDFSGVDKPRNEHSFYGLRYAEFVVPLVKAVQEQQQIINELIKQNENLQQRIINLEKNPVNSNSSSGNTKDVMSAWPNPSNDIVLINLIAESESRATIKVFDNRGALVKEHRASVLKGSNQVTIDIKTLPAATYHFTAEWDNGKMKRTVQVVKY